MCKRHNWIAKKAIIRAAQTSTMARSGFATIKAIGGIARADIKSLPDKAGRTVNTFSAIRPLCLSARYRSSRLRMVSRSVASDPRQLLKAPLRCVRAPAGEYSQEGSLSIRITSQYAEPDFRLASAGSLEREGSCAVHT